MREANKHLKAESSTQNGLRSGISKISSSGRKRNVDVLEKSSNPIEAMESEIDDLSSQLQGRDVEVKVSNACYNYPSISRFDLEI